VLGSDYISAIQPLGAAIMCHAGLLDLRYRPAWRSCINLHATAATRMFTIAHIVGRLKSSATTFL
jgi:hypothetical protein